mmetsp:Transcript_104151/g.301303  ORF Transcript_104151/g.301303 Transcript_104151/m.301303 type:complete len:207 (-) Transcript_104151:18-638(-)
MMSRISACIADSASMSLWSTSSLRPGVPLGMTFRSVFFVRFFIFLTSTHSNLGSFFFLGFSADFSSAFSSPSGFSSSGFASPSPALASPSAGFSAAASSFAVSPSCGWPASALAPLVAGSSAACSSFSGGSSRFSFTTSSYSSSSTSCAPSTWKMPCNESFARTLTFFASVWGGTSILKVPSSLGVSGSSTLSSANSALISKGPFR